MNQNQEIISELKEVNKKLEKISNPIKFAWLNFFAGTFHALGTIFGTVIISGILIYIFSQLNFTKSISIWLENTLSQVKWEKVIAPQTIQQNN